MIVPGVLVHFETDHSSEHERFLYNTIRYQLQGIIAEYLRTTQRPFPIYVIFDMSHLASQL